MRFPLKLVIASVVVLAGVSASAQPPQLPPELLAVLPEGVDLESAYECPDPVVESHKAECCRIKVVIDETGKATSAKANCTHAPLEPVMAQCQLNRPHEPRIRTGGKREGYTTTFTQTHLARPPRSAEEYVAMSDEADKRCDLIKDPD